MKMYVKKLKEVRELKNIGQVDLSLKTGYSQSYISMIEQGKRTINIKQLLMFSEALDCPIECIMDKKEEKKFYIDDIKNQIQKLSNSDLRKVCDYIKLIRKANFH